MRESLPKIWSFKRLPRTTFQKPWSKKRKTWRCVKRDLSTFVLEQKLELAQPCPLLGQGITMILKDAEEPLDRLELLKKLADAGKLMSLQLLFSVNKTRFTSFIRRKPDRENKSRKVVIEKSERDKKTCTSNISKFLLKTGRQDRPVPARTLNWRGSEYEIGELISEPKKQVSAKKSPDNLSKQQGRVRQCIQGGQQDPEIKLCGQEEVDNQVRLVAGRLSHFPPHEWRRHCNQ
ncbi:hypothetical protein KQX54_000637 [Cotesia glomerata]|uniref:Uncharacterized protein n=1 Tax=Cotesia glomerata TaxID=32391 RepID=A0AAV7HZ34_COTGL|nr:hypothetical protein KQX54_000637 [Cotesia glomerata]